MKGIRLLWSRGRHFFPSLPGDRYLNLGSKSDHRPKTRGTSFGTTLWPYFQGYCAYFHLFMQITCSGYSFAQEQISRKLIYSSSSKNWKMTHWDMLSKATKFELSLFNMVQCVICSPVWRFWTTRLLSCKGLIDVLKDHTINRGCKKSVRDHCSFLEKMYNYVYLARGITKTRLYSLVVTPVYTFRTGRPSL